MFADKRRVNRQEFLRLSGAGLAGAGLLLGGVRCGGGEGTGENAIGWQAIPSYSPQAPDKKRVDYLNQSISDWDSANRTSRRHIARRGSTPWPRLRLRCNSTVRGPQMYWPR